MEQVFRLDLEEGAFVQALKKLCKLERQAKILRLAYAEPLLLVQLGSTTEAIEAQGTWTKPVFVDRRWGVALVSRPYGNAVLTLSVAEGKIRARDFSVKCFIAEGPGEIDMDELATRRRTIAGATEALAAYHVTEEDIEALIDKARGERRRGWGDAERAVFDRVDRAWWFLASYGIEPFEIRALVDEKTKSLFLNPPKRR